MQIKFALNVKNLLTWTAILSKFTGRCAEQVCLSHSEFIIN